MDECQKPFRGHAAVAGTFDVVPISNVVNLVETDQRGCVRATANDPRCGGVVRDAVDPRSQRTPAVEKRQAPPEREVDFLQEVTASFGIVLIGPREPLDGGSEAISDLACRGRPVRLSARFLRWRQTSAAEIAS